MSTFPTSVNRQPAGTPTGGQFAAGSTGESGLVLDAYPLEPHDTIAAPVDELRGIDSDLAELHERGIKEDSRAVRALVEQRTQIIGNLTVDAEYVDLEDEGVAGKVIAYAKDGTIIFTDGSYSSVDGPTRPCGHKAQTPGCGGCDPGAVDLVIDEGSLTPRPFDPAKDMNNSSDDPYGLRYTPPDAPLPHTHPAVRAGEVREHVTHPDYGMFTRRRDGVVPVEPYAMRFQSDRPISDEEIQRAAQVIGYAYRADVAGEPMGDPQRDSPYSFVIAADTTKSQRTDPDQALLDFEDSTRAMMRDGSPVRKTNSAYGQAGTRLVEGFGEDAPHFELYYDSTQTVPNEKQRQIEGHGR